MSMLFKVQLCSPHMRPAVSSSDAQKQLRVKVCYIFGGYCS